MRVRSQRMRRAQTLKVEEVEGAPWAAKVLKVIWAEPTRISARSPKSLEEIALSAMLVAYSASLLSWSARTESRTKRRQGLRRLKKIHLKDPLWQHLKRPWVTTWKKRWSSWQSSKRTRVSALLSRTWRINQSQSQGLDQDQGRNRRWSRNRRQWGRMLSGLNLATRAVVVRRLHLAWRSKAQWMTRSMGSRFRV